MMSNGQCNIISPVINIFTYIYVIHKLICDILGMHLGKTQLQFMAYILHQSLPERRIRPRLLMPRVWGTLRGFMIGSVCGTVTSRSRLTPEGPIRHLQDQD